jgi:hypothetical protein
MRKPTLTIDTFVAALAVLSIGTSAGCSKAEEAKQVSAEPAPAAPPKPLASAPTPAASVAAHPIADAGADARSREDKKPGSASCGAGTCSADMKKGN